MITETHRAINRILTGEIGPIGGIALYEKLRLRLKDETPDQFTYDRLLRDMEEWNWIRAGNNGEEVCFELFENAAFILAAPWQCDPGVNPDYEDGKDRSFLVWAHGEGHPNNPMSVAECHTFAAAQAIVAAHQKAYPELYKDVK